MQKRGLKEGMESGEARDEGGKESGEARDEGGMESGEARDEGGMESGEALCGCFLRVLVSAP